MRNGIRHGLKICQTFVTLTEESLSVLARRFSIPRGHRETVVILPVVQLQLLVEILKRRKRVCRIKVFIVFAAAALNLAFVPGGLVDQFVANPQLLQSLMKEGVLVRNPAEAEPFRKFLPVFGLDALDGRRERPREIFREQHG